MRAGLMQTLYNWSGRIYVIAVVVGAVASFAIWWLGSALSRVQEAQIAGLDERAQQLRRDNLKLEAQLKPRRLTPEQERVLTATFARYPGDMVHVSSYMQDVDGAMLGEQLLRSAASAGLKTDDFRMALSSFRDVTVGLSVTGTDPNMVANVTSVLRSFDDMVPVSNGPIQGNYMNVEDEGKPFPLKIFIGAKPLPPVPVAASAKGNP